MPGRTIEDFEARAQKIQIFTLQDAVAFNAADLNGKTQLVSSYEVVWMWFVPDGGYDGTVFFEASPDGGVTWLAVQGVQPNALGTLITNIASPTATDSVYVPIPTFSHIRARMDGGTQGSLTVFARLVDIKASIG